MKARYIYIVFDSFSFVVEILESSIDVLFSVAFEYPKSVVDETRRGDRVRVAGGVVDTQYILVTRVKFNAKSGWVLEFSCRV